MQVIKIDPGCAPQLVDIPNTLEALQQAVGGYIEMITVRLDIRGLRPLVLIVNEEGRLMGLPANGSLMVPTAARHLLVGPVLIAPAGQKRRGSVRRDRGAPAACDLLLAAREGRCALMKRISEASVLREELQGIQMELHILGDKAREALHALGTPEAGRASDRVILDDLAHEIISVEQIFGGGPRHE